MKALLEKIKKILRNRRTRQLLTRTVSVIAAFIVFVTTYALVLPAITMETEALCGMDAHQHDESCYSKELVCGLEESEDHMHTEECYINILTCGKEAHTHSVECYNGRAELTVQMEAAAVASTESAAIAEPNLTDEGSGEYTAEMSQGSESDYKTGESGLPEDAEPAPAETETVTGADENFENPKTDEAADGADAAADEPVDEADDAAADEDLESGTKEKDNGPGAVSEGSDKGSSEEGNREDLEDLAEDENDGKAAADPDTGAATDASETTEITDSKDASNTAGTEIPSADAGEGYVPVLEELNFSSILNKNTAIYYSHTDTQTDDIADEEESGTSDTAGLEGREDLSEAAAFESATDWRKVDKDTELAPADLLRVYLAYTIPAGELNETNAAARYRLPSGFTLTDEQINTINTNVNGIAAQYVDYDKLEIIDAQAYENSLGIEAVEGTRCPSDDIREYLKENDDQEYVSATVKVENIYDDASGELEGQDLIFSFAPYTIMKNRHEYDVTGKPVKAGEKVRGWVCLDLTTDQIEWETSLITMEDIEDTEDAEETGNTENPVEETEREKKETTDRNAGTVRQIEEKTAELIFAEKDKEAGIDEISVKLKMAVGQNPAEAEDSDLDSAEATEDEGTETGGDIEAAEDEGSESEGNREEAQSVGVSGDVDPADYPAVSFDDKITVTAGSLNTDTESGSSPEKVTELRVHVEADEGTFPAGTTMRLAEADPDTVAVALEGAVEGKTKGFHAVDISFWSTPGDDSSDDSKGSSDSPSKEPIEIEPLKPIRVSITSEAIRQAVEDSSTAPVVMHIEEPTDKTPADKAPEDSADEDSTDSADNASTGNAGQEQDVTDMESGSTDQEETAGNMDSQTLKSETAGNADTLTFEADSFSVYAVVYTVDFHYEADGKSYDFSIPGGGFVSLEHIVEVLGIASADENTENEAENGENGTQNGDDPAGEVPGADESGENGKNGEGRADETADSEAGQSADSTAFEEAVKLNEVDVSEAAKKFAADVESVEFSSPELVWVGKVDSAATVGGLKETNGLKVEYSAELTEEQIAEINNSTIEAGDWALISMQPFTSEESLTVTMKNGDQFAVKVTDAQISTHVITADGKDYIITVTYGPEAGIPDGAKLEAEEIPEGTEEYQSYLERTVSAARLESTESISFVRFFDINILADGEELEPIAPVRVSVTYANSVDVPDGRQLAVHFADSGVEVLDAKAEKAEATAANTFVFEQSSFSVTGTLVENGAIESGAQYMIVYSMSGADVKYYNNGSWHSIGDAGTTYYFALAGDGTTKALVYDPTTGVFSYVKDDYVSWTFNRNSNGAYTVYNADSGNYLNMGDANSLVRNSANNNILVENQNNGRFKIRNNANNWTYSNRTLAWNINYPNNNSRGGVNYTVNANPIDVMLVKVNDAVPSYPSYDGYETGDDFDTDVLQDWLDELEESDEAINSYSKTAQCVDYDDRIYRVDLNAASGKHAFDGVMDLSFILDVSPSMFFPADLEPVTSNPIAINTTNLNNLAGNTNSPVVFYVISDPENTSTNYAFYRNSRYGGWTYCDASTLSVNSSGQYTSSNPNPNISGGAQGSIPNTGNMVLRDGANVNYTVYQAVEYQGAERQRMYYLQSNMNAAIDVLKELAIFTGDTDSNISYVTFGKVPKNWGTAKVKDGITLNYQTEGGTRQDLALAKALELGYFNTDASRTKYAILITDGAPVHTSSTVPAEYIDNEILRYANELKAKGVKLITVGLSTHDVPNGKFILHEVADSIGDKLMFYEAENGNELQYVLRDILETILAEASVTGTVTDTIDEAFYPVDAQGNPLHVGDTITVDNVTGVIGKSGNNYTVTWGNASSPVEFPWDIEEDNTKNGWTGSFYIKSKEDFLGGNDINTNKDATITADKFLVRNSDGTIVVGPKNLGTPTIISGTDSHIASGTNKLPSPVVNVDDLTMTDQSTTWTVYRGTDVDPKDEIERIYNAIRINEVVTETRDDDENDVPDHVIRTDSGENIGGTGGTPEQFCLKDIPGLETLDWSKALNTNGYTVDYNKYGHAAGKIRVVVEVLEGNESDLTGTQPHVADTVGAPAEKYRLTVSYEPKAETIPYEQSHIKEDEEKGSAISTTSYQNEHTINVIEKKLEVTKVGSDGTTALADLPAKFTLYKESASGSAVEGLPADKKFEAIEVTTVNGTASWEYLQPVKAETGSETYWEPETVFYIKETQPPEDYAAYPDYITVKLNITETSPVIGNAGTDPYDTVQSATVTIIGDTTEEGHEDEAYVKVTGNTGNTVQFSVKNELMSEITLKKADKTSGQLIPGAKFSLKKGLVYADLSRLTIVNLDENGQPTTTPAAIETIHRTNPEMDIEVIVVPKNGIKISGLTNGNYELKEEAPPDGYIITDSGTTFTAADGKVLGETNHVFTIENEPGAALPSTGGPGTTLLYLLGVMLTALAGAGMLMKQIQKRKV